MVTVIIPTTRGGALVERAVERAAVAAAGLPGAEILLVVNGDAARQRPSQIGRSYVRLCMSEARGAGAARNVGLQQARHDIILFTDDDCLVPRSWCLDLAERLASGSPSAVAAPVRVEVSGPVTAFLDYQRIFDAPPLHGRQVHYVVTANCGMRRSRTTSAITFDPVTFVGAGGEDAEFGYRLRESRCRIEWLPDVAPVVHVLAEDMCEITDRFVRYGRGSARLYHGCGRWRESVPGALGWYRQLCANEGADHRRFREMVDGEVRLAFATYDLLLTASFLVGYLEELGRLLGYPLLTPDHGGLRHGWQYIAGDLARRIGHVPVDSWTKLRIDYMSFWRAPNDAQLPLAAIAANLSEHAPPPVSELPAEIVRVLDRWELEHRREQAETLARLRGLLHVVRGLQTSGAVQLLEQWLRESGVPFKDGCHDIERLAHDGARARREPSGTEDIGWRS